MTDALATHAEKESAVGTVAACSDTRLWRYALTVCGWLLSALSGLTLFAWACGEQEYLQLDAKRPPLHYNGALGFLVWGGAYLTLARGRLRAARWFAGALFGLGAVVLCVSVPGVGIRLDGWAVSPSRYSLPLGPGGVTPGLGFGFIVGGLAIVLTSRRTVSPLVVITGTLLGFVLVIGPTTILVMTRAGGLLPEPAVPSLLGGVGVGIAGLAMLTFGFRRSATSLVLSYMSPLTIGFAGIGLTFALWLTLNTEQDKRIQRQMQFETAHAQRIVLDRLPVEVRRVVEIAEKWSDAANDDMIPEQMKLDAGNYMGGLPGCLGIAHVDERQRVTWIERNGQQPLAFTDLGGGEALARAVRTGEVTVVRPPRSYWRGTRVMLIFAPHRAKTPGGLISVVTVQQFYDNIFNANVAPSYGVTVYEGDDPVYTRYGIHHEAPSYWSQSLPLSFRGHEWRLTMWPTPNTLARENLSLPKIALLVGLLTTSLLVLAIHLAQTARRRTHSLEIEARERKFAEQALRQSEEKYRSLIENLGQGIFLQDDQRRYVAANLQFCRSVGRTEAEIIGATDADLFDSDRAANCAEEVRMVLANGQSIESEAEVLVGERRTCVRRVLTPVCDATGRTTGVLGICWDVTEQRQLESHVNQASKMDAIGQLAGGIAHDFNNLLTVILGNLELMLTDLAPTHPDHELVVSAQSAAVRAAALTQRLLGFSRRHQLDWHPTDFNGVVMEVVALLHRTIDPLVRIETHLDLDVWTVQGDPTQLNQVLMNLCLNARDAISGSGRISIETTCVTSAEAQRAKVPNARGEFVRLRVTDTGVGMTPEVKARIYEPFFTTKDVGKGTGLGLAMVFAIVRQHKGWIDCASEVGEGTRFDIYLPRGESPKLAESTKHAPLACRTGKETILVVDDEELIRSLATATLQGRGYSVLQAADGQQAVEVYAREKDRIDLVILDLTMPLLSGHEAFRRLLHSNPHVKVLFVSGYSSEQLSDLEKELMAGFLKKPYRPNELILVVEDALLRCGESRPAKPMGALT